MERSLTEGNSLRQILRFAFPLLLGNMFQQLYNLADSVIVGRTLGVDALAAVGASSSLNFLILGFCNGSCSGFTIPVSQRFGAKDYPMMRRYVFNAAALTAALALVITTITAVFCRQILVAIQTPENIMDGAYAYLFVIFLGIPFTMLYNLSAGILRALGDSKSPFLFLAISTVLNIFGDLFTILVLDMGVEGAAIATIAAQAVSGFCCVWFMKKKFSILRMTREERTVRSDQIRTLLMMGLPMGLQFSITAIGSVMLQSAVNALGSVIVASFSAAAKVKMLMMAPFDALGNTAATFCGQNMGAGKIDRIKRGIFEMMAIGISYSLLATLIMVLFGGKIVSVFVGSAEVEVIKYAHLQLRCMGYFFFLLAFINIMRSAVQGMGHSGSAMVAGLLEMVARSAMSWFAIPTYGFLAACFTDQAAWVVASVYIFADLAYILRRAESSVQGARSFDRSKEVKPRVRNRTRFSGSAR